jgi:hypothetical protein
VHVHYHHDSNFETMCAAYKNNPVGIPVWVGLLDTAAWFIGCPDFTLIHVNVG